MNEENTCRWAAALGLASKPNAFSQPDVGKKSAALWIFVSFFALYMLSMADGMLDFADSHAMILAAGRMLDHGVGASGEAMHEKWCLGQLVLDLIIVGLRRLSDGSGPAQQLVLARLQAALPCMIGAGAPTLVYLIGVRLGFARLTAALAAAGVGLGTMTWVYTQVLFSESTLALLWLIIVYAMLVFHQSGRLRWLVVAGCAGGYALITKTATAAVLPILPLWTVVAMLSRRSPTRVTWRSAAAACGALIIPLAAFATLNLWYNYARFADFSSAGYGDGRDGFEGGFTTPLSVGLFGLLLSPGKGVFFYNPISVLGLFGLRPFLRQHWVAGLAILGVTLGLVLVHARWWAWHGDWAWGPRFTVPWVPLFALFSLPTIARVLSMSAGWRTLYLALMAALLHVSVGVQIAGLSFDPARFIDVVSTKCDIFRGGTYFKERDFPLLDDGLMLHYVPQFSPIPGHLWMLRASVAPDETTRHAILADPPWRVLNPKWVPRHPEQIDTRTGFWWTQGDASDGARRRATRAILVGLCLVLGWGAIATVRRLRARPTYALSPSRS